MIMWLHENDAVLPIVKKKYYAVRLDAVLLTMIKFFPNEEYGMSKAIEECDYSNNQECKLGF